MDARTGRRPYRALVPAAAAALLLATACSPEDANNPGEGGEDHLRLATGSTGGTYFPLGGGMAERWSDELADLTVSVQASGASVENMRLLQGGEVELVMAVNGVAHDAVAGAGEFEGEEYDVTALGNIYREVTQIVARADAGIETVDDLAGARVQIGPPGSGTAVSARQILSQHGIDPDEDIDAFQGTFGDAADQLRDGTVDAAFAILALPAGSITDVATGTDLTMVSIGDDVADQMLADDPSLSTVDVPAGTYPGQEEDAQWVTNWATLYATPHLADDRAQELLEVMYGQMDAETVGHAVADEIEVDTALDGLGDVPLHPGAQQYYDDHGLELP